MTKAAERQEAIDTLKEQFALKPGDALYTKLVHVSRSGMYRAIDVYKIVDNTPLRLSWPAATACGLRYDTKHEAVGMGGCGMDMGFSLVYELSSVLFPEGFACIGKGSEKGYYGPDRTCHSNDHSNGDRSYHKHKARGPVQVCEFCDGSGTVERHYLGSGEPTHLEPCRTCHGVGTLGPKHWHANGGYALRQRWL